MFSDGKSTTANQFHQAQQRPPKEKVTREEIIELVRYRMVGYKPQKNRVIDLAIEVARLVAERGLDPESLFINIEIKKKPSLLHQQPHIAGPQQE